MNCSFNLHFGLWELKERAHCSSTLSLSVVDCVSEPMDALFFLFLKPQCGSGGEKRKMDGFEGEKRQRIKGWKMDRKRERSTLYFFASSLLSVCLS